MPGAAQPAAPGPRQSASAAGRPAARGLRTGWAGTSREVKRAPTEWWHQAAAPPPALRVAALLLHCATPGGSSVGDLTRQAVCKPQLEQVEQVQARRQAAGNWICCCTTLVPGPAPSTASRAGRQLLLSDRQPNVCRISIYSAGGGGGIEAPRRKMPSLRPSCGLGIAHPTC